MRCTVLVALGSALLLALPAVAQRQVTPPPGIDEPPPPPPGGLSVSPEGRILVSADVCTRLRRAEAAAPGAAYRPGVDVNGEAVAPADLPSDTPPLALDNLPVAIGAGMQKRYGVSGTSTLRHRGAVIGMVTLRDGRIYFNGEPIGDNERDMMLAACAEATK